MIYRFIIMAPSISTYLYIYNTHLNTCNVLYYSESESNVVCCAMPFRYVYGCLTYFHSCLFKCDGEQSDEWTP